MNNKNKQRKISTLNKSLGIIRKTKIKILTGVWEIKYLIEIIALEKILEQKIIGKKKKNLISIIIQIKIILNLSLTKKIIKIIKKK